MPENVQTKLQKCRVALQGMPIKKSGRNNHLKADYFELGDFLPVINKLFLEHGLCGAVSFDKEIATLTVSNLEEPADTITFTTPMSTAKLANCHEVQNLGAVQTYLRRYLYVNALEIVESDALDSSIGKPETKRQEKQPTAEQVAKAENPGDLSKQLLAIAKSMPFDTADVTDMFKTLGIKKFAELPVSEQQLHLDDMNVRVQCFHEMLNAFEADAPVGEEPDKAKLVDQVMEYLGQRSEKNEKRPLRCSAAVWTKWANELKETLFNERSKQ